MSGGLVRQRLLPVRGQVIALATSRILVRRPSGSVLIVVGPSRHAEHWALAVLYVLTAVFIPAVVAGLLGAGPLARGFAQRGAVAPPVVVLLLGGLMLACLFIMIVGVLWNLFGREEILVAGDTATLATVLLGVRRERRFPIAIIRKVRWGESSLARKGGTFVRRTLVFDADGETVRGRSHLSIPDANLLAREVEDALASTAAAISSEAASETAAR